MPVPGRLVALLAAAGHAAAEECAAGLTVLDGTCYKIVNTNYVRNFTTDGADECCAACAAEDQCTHFEWDKTPGRHPSTCFLISGMPKVKDTVTTCISGEPSRVPVPTPVPAPPGAKNVLYIIFDDLRPNLENYGQGYMHTPHLSSFAQSSGAVTFTQAHVQSQMCVPTRASFLTGRRPQTTLVMNAGVGNDNFRVTGPSWTTMPQHFRQQGWFTTSVGKVFHKAPNHDQRLSWSETLFDPKVMPCDNASHVWCAVQDASAEYEDEQSLAEAQVRLRRLAAQDQPFFMAVGFHKPHTPYRAPQAFFDLYPEQKEIAEPKHPEFPKDQNLTGLSWFSCKAEDNQYPISHSKNYDRWVQRVLRRAYYAAVSYADDLFGRLLATLEEVGAAENTAVVVHGDHGYQLGEYNVYCKESNFNRATNVPLMIRAPWRLSSAPQGVKSSAMVELVDLFPTLAELVGAPPLDISIVEEPALEGKSFLPVLDGVAAASGFDANAFNYSFSQYSRNRCLSDLFEQKAKNCPTGKFGLFTGFSVRSPHWRYTRWVSVEATAGAPSWEDVRSEELYRYGDPLVTDFDDTDTENLAYNDDYAWALKDMRHQLRQGFSQWIRSESQVLV